MEMTDKSGHVLVIFLSMVLVTITARADLRPSDVRLSQALDLKPYLISPADIGQTAFAKAGSVPVGTAVAGTYVESRGALIAQTYYDFLGSGGAGRTVATNPPDLLNPKPAGIHFAIFMKGAPGIGSSTNPGAIKRMGYACYDPSGSGSFPLPGGEVIVAEVNPTSLEGGSEPQIAALPDGRAVVAGSSWAEPDDVRHWFNQMVIDYAPLAGIFGNLTGGSIIAKATSQAQDFDTMHYPTIYPSLCLDINGTGPEDTLFYVLTTAVWSVNDNGIFYRNRWYGQGKVFRKNGTSMPGIDPAWTLVFTDSGSFYGAGNIACDPTSARIATFTSIPFAEDSSGASGYQVRWADSPTGNSGTWTRHRVPNLSTTSVDMPFYHVEGMFDTQGKLHVIFSATYRGPDYNYELERCRGIHWSEYDPERLTVFYNATWPRDRSCGLNGQNAFQNISQLTIGECDNRLYIAYSSANDPSYVPNGDDCVRSQSWWHWKGNGEIYVTVSRDLTGRSWDKPRNVSNSYTPNCDTGTCAADKYPSLSWYGMDDADFAGSESWGTSGATWDLSGGGYTGSEYIQLYYLQDKYPSIGGMGMTGGLVPPYTLNDMRWVRMSCAGPVIAADLSLSRDVIGWPEWGRPGSERLYRIALNSIGNTDLLMNSVTAVLDSAKGSGAGPGNWMTVTGAPVSIPESGTDSLTVTLNPGGMITSGPTVLYGKIRFQYSPPAQIKELAVQFTVADTVAGIVWDTIATACVELTVGTDGNIGHLGGDGADIADLGRVNMDYFGPADCDTGDNSRGFSGIYLFDGSPVIIRKTAPGSYRGSWSLHSNGLLSPTGFRPMTGVGYAPHGSGSTASYDVFNSGTFLTSDSLVKVEKTWWAPKHPDSCNFIVQRLLVFATTTGTSVSNLQIGEALDFDIPSDSGLTNNVSGSDQNRRLVWMRGFNSQDYGSDCVDNSRRYGGAALLNWHMKGGGCFDSLYSGKAVANDVYLYPANGFVVDSVSRAMHDAGYAVENRVTDQTLLFTYKDGVDGYTLRANDTLTIYTALATVRTAYSTNAGLDSLKRAIDKAKNFLKTDLGYCGSCCTGVTGNVNMSGIVDLSDLSALVSYLTGGGYVLPCSAEANVNNVGIVDLSDLSALVSYLTGGGYVLPNCS